MKFQQFFSKAAGGKDPYPFQGRFAEADHLPHLVFEMSHSPMHGLQAFALKQHKPNIRLVDIGAKLGISKRSAC